MSDDDTSIRRPGATVRSNRADMAGANPGTVFGGRSTPGRSNVATVHRFSKASTRRQV